jgi:hypothetical protein
VNLAGDFLSAESWERYIKNSGGLLQYPPNLGYDAELQNYVLFDIYEVIGQSLSVKQNKTEKKDPFIESAEKASSEGVEKVFSDGSKSLEENVDVEVADELVEEVADAVVENTIAPLIVNTDPALLKRAKEGRGIISYNAASLGFAANPKRLNVSIALPMPAQLNTNYGFEYEDVDYTGLMNLIAAKNAITSMADGNEVDATTKELLRKVTSIPSGVIDSLSNIFGSDSVNLVDAANMRRGQAPNKYKEQTFKGVTRRSFSFEWELSPRSREDALRIYSIVYAFKKYAHPSRTEGGMYLNYPAQFKIGFYTRSELNDFLFRIALCGCTKCEVTYGGEDLSFFRDFLATSEPFSPQSSFFGSPANTLKLSLEFTELELLTQERIQQGY